MLARFKAAIFSDRELNIPQGFKAVCVLFLIQTVICFSMVMWARHIPYFPLRPADDLFSAMKGTCDQTMQERSVIFLRIIVNNYGVVILYLVGTQVSYWLREQKSFMFSKIFILCLMSIGYIRMVIGTGLSIGGVEHITTSGALEIQMAFQMPHLIFEFPTFIFLVLNCCRCGCIKSSTNILKTLGTKNLAIILGGITFAASIEAYVTPLVLSTIVN